MLLIWNDIARGDRERAAVLVVFNALFQLAAYSLLGYFYLTLLPGWLGLDTQGFEVGIWEVARTVLIFLGIRCCGRARVRPAGGRRARFSSSCRGEVIGVAFPEEWYDLVIPGGACGWGGGVLIGSLRTSRTRL